MSDLRCADCKALVFTMTGHVCGRPSRRDLLAGMAMQGIISYGARIQVGPSILIENSVILADQLIAELDKSLPPKQ